MLFVLHCDLDLPLQITSGESHAVCIAVPSRFLLFSDAQTLRFLSVDNAAPRPVLSPLVNLSFATAVDYDARTQQVYWTDSSHDSVYVEGLQGTKRRQIVKGLSNAHGLAVDWVSSLLYFTDEALSLVGVASLDGRYVMTLIGNDLRLPRPIAVDPQQGLERKLHQKEG